LPKGNSLPVVSDCIGVEGVLFFQNLDDISQPSEVWQAAQSILKSAP
jgi:hypothetical protein